MAMSKSATNMQEGAFGVLESSTAPAVSSDAPQPTILKVDWLPGRVFTVKDDPDRALQPHVLPKVLAKEQRWDKDHLSTEAVDVSLAETGAFRCRDPATFAMLVHGVLLPEECKALIAMANTKGFTPALLNIGYGRQQYMPEIRLNQRCIIDEPHVADLLWQRLQHVIPKEWHGRCAQSVNERLRILCYHEPGQVFEAHFDGNFTRRGDHPRAGETSFVTLQVYLNEGFTGGHTSFISRDHEKVAKVAPTQGSVLMFSQDLFHEGSPIEDGFKYTLRTEVMYAPLSVANHHKIMH
jgi:hypothetical protein|eukprot:CAMPEP_0174286084 /NCGR_PEP_ID=MMETSP0809-20121228/10612_1 /TAXON_ID=73025 ORGANISM="Eutreptiella gymnastica-like, Strain CCMP1594" /NCGR_SAMPLE_ID=MMETSP0809 /ASSEMBLY_ACC=CAM_ASM_000658 /LENGTH=294 /DNA_ID=CAMNT_0015382019 /DNA_START=76 /DNA_END=960 /DNA_ORIENTATION=-